MQQGPKKRPEPCEEDPSRWAEDQERRGYYYDDAHGYEKYEPDSEDEEPENLDDGTTS